MNALFTKKKKQSEHLGKKYFDFPQHCNYNILISGTWHAANVVGPQEFKAIKCSNALFTKKKKQLEHLGKKNFDFPQHCNYNILISGTWPAANVIAPQEFKAIKCSNALSAKKKKQLEHLGKKYFDFPQHCNCNILNSSIWPGANVIGPQELKAIKCSNALFAKKKKQSEHLGKKYFDFPQH